MSSAISAATSADIAAEWEARKAAEWRAQQMQAEGARLYVEGAKLRLEAIAEWQRIIRKAGLAPAKYSQQSGRLVCRLADGRTLLGDINAE